MEITLLLNVFLVVANTVYAVCKKKNNRILIVISFICLFILMAGYRGSLSGTGLSHDMFNYSRTYNVIQSGEDLTSFIEPGYFLIISFFGAILRIDFLTYYAIMHAICLFLIFRMAKLYGANIHVVLTLFSVFFMVYACEQFQNYISIVIATYAICILITGGKRFTKLKFIIGILVAASIHYTSIVYLMFVFFKNKKMITAFVILVLLLIFIKLLSGSGLYFNHIMTSGLLGDALHRYSTSTNMGYLYGVFFQCINIIVLYINHVLLQKIQNRNDVLSSQSKAVNHILAINLLACAFIPLYMINVQAIRLVRWLLLIDFLSCSITMSGLNVNSKKVMMSVYLLWIFIFAVITFVCLNATVEAVLLPFYQLNAFVNWLV